MEKNKNLLKVKKIMLNNFRRGEVFGILAIFGFSLGSTIFVNPWISFIIGALVGITILLIGENFFVKARK